MKYISYQMLTYSVVSISVCAFSRLTSGYNNFLHIYFLNKQSNKVNLGTLYSNELLKEGSHLLFKAET